MNININSIAEYSAKKFFGLEKTGNLTEFGFENLVKLKSSMMEKFKIVDLGEVDDWNFSELLLNPTREKKIKEFREKGLATLNIKSSAYNSDYANHHTIGLAINKPTNQYFYQTTPEILVIDSMGDNYPGARDIHQDLIWHVIEPMFPGSGITVSKTSQQTDGSLTCLNWTLANLKVVKENIGRADILNLLPKSNDLPKILEEQKQFLINNPYKF